MDVTQQVLLLFCLVIIKITKKLLFIRSNILTVLVYVGLLNRNALQTFR